MVGIVIVSHSASLAEGTAELAREMGGPDLVLEAAGGLDLPDRPMGTDAVLIMGAIERAAAGGDGVLVLMDLGSALLSTEMALDLLPDDVRARVLLCDAPLVEGAVAAAVTARMGAPLAEVAEQARAGLAAKVAHLAPAAPAAAAPPAPSPAGGSPAELRFVMKNPIGLHARPAARFVQAAGAFEADVQVSNLTMGRGPVTARSLVQVMALGVLQGHEVGIRATGPRSREALEAIQALVDANFGDAPQP